MRVTLAIAGLWVSVAATGCQQAAAPAAPTPPPPATTAGESAATLDTRTPVPLLPMMAQHQKENMRAHLAAVQEIVAALGKDDFAGVEAATKKIGFSEPMAKMCTHMGAGAPGFTPTAIAFHRTADTIAGAAKKKDRAAAFAALDATLAACVACHASYKQQVVDEATWTRLTSMAPPMGAHPMPSH